MAFVKRWFRKVDAIAREAYAMPYRRTFARARRDQEDLFLMLVMSESLGIPNPAGTATLELLPEVLDRMHDWHVRLEMSRAPWEDGLRCC